MTLTTGDLLFRSGAVIAVMLDILLMFVLDNLSV